MIICVTWLPFHSTGRKMAIIKNPLNPYPDEIGETLTELLVRYRDFQGKEHKGVIEVHRAVAEDVAEFFSHAFSLGYPIEKVVRSSDPTYKWDDDKLLADNASSGFNYRFIKETTRPSLHGRGLAFDINTRINPYIRFDNQGLNPLIDPPGAHYDPTAVGALTSNHPLVVLMKEKGWEWGGDWYDRILPDGSHVFVTDYQHFQKVID